MDETTTALIYGLSDDSYQIGPYLNDGSGNPLFPEVVQGYYRLIDRQDDTEQDILDGCISSPEAKLKVLVNKALGQPDIH